MNRLQQSAKVTLIIVVSILLASYFLAMLLGPALLYFTSAGLDFGMEQVQPPVFLLFLFGFRVPFALTANLLFLFVWSVFALCFTAAWKLRASFTSAVSNVFSQPLSKLFSNWLFVMPIVASASLTAVLLIIALQNVAGVPTGGLPAPQTDAERFFLYLNISIAPIIEEIGFRIIPIGAFFLVASIVNQSSKIEQTSARATFGQRFQTMVYAFLYPDKAKRMMGMKNVASNGIWQGISLAEWILLLLTSLVFGAAHLASGIGWEFGKITSAFLQGFMFGLVYLAYGAEAPILLHWFFNYYFYTYELGGRYISSLFDANALETVTFWIGAAFLIAFAILGAKKLLKRETQTPQPSEAGVTSTSPESL